MSLFPTRRAALAALAALAAGQPALAHQTFHNRTGETVFLRVTRLAFGQAVVRMQLHLGGKTPAPKEVTVIQEDVKAAKKVLNKQGSQYVDARLHTLTNTTRPGQVGYGGLVAVPSGSTLVFSTLSPEEQDDASSTISFRIETAQGSGEGLETGDEHLDFSYRTRLEPGRGPVEALLPAVIHPLAGAGEHKGEGFAHRFRFESEDGLLSLVTPGTAAGCSVCAIQ